MCERSYANIIVNKILVHHAHLKTPSSQAHYKHRWKLVIQTRRMCKIPHCVDISHILEEFLEFTSTGIMPACTGSIALAFVTIYMYRTTT